MYESVRHCFMQRVQSLTGLIFGVVNASYLILVKLLVKQMLFACVRECLMASLTQENPWRSMSVKAIFFIGMLFFFCMFALVAEHHLSTNSSLISMIIFYYILRCEMTKISELNYRFLVSQQKN